MSDGLRAIAIETLQSVCGDVQAPAAARAAAARTLLELIGAIGRLQEPERTRETPVSELSASELDREIDRLGAIANGAAKTPRRSTYRLL